MRFEVVGVASYGVAGRIFRSGVVHEIPDDDALAPLLLSCPYVHKIEDAGGGASAAGLPSSPPSSKPSPPPATSVLTTEDLERGGGIRRRSE